MKPNRKEIRTEASNPTESLRPESYLFTWTYTLVKQTPVYRSCDKAILPERETIRSMQHSIS